MRTKLILILSVAITSFANAGNVIVKNTNNADDAAYGIFDQGGTLLPLAGDATIRFGISSLTNSEITTAYASGDLTTIDSSFTNFGSTFGLVFADGVFQSDQNGITTSFDGQSMVLWLSSELTFTSNSAQYLIYRFDENFGAEPFSSSALLGTTSGTLLVGQFGNFSHDYGFGGGSLPGFNTVSVVPEPGQAALVLAFSILGIVYFRRKKSSGE